MRLVRRFWVVFFTPVLSNTLVLHRFWIQTWARRFLPPHSLSLSPNRGGGHAPPEQERGEAPAAKAATGPGVAAGARASDRDRERDEGRCRPRPRREKLPRRHPELLGE